MARPTVIEFVDKIPPGDFHGIFTRRLRVRLDDGRMRIVPLSAIDPEQRARLRGPASA